jgi:hypothetical protein
MLSGILLPALKKRFPDRGLRADAARWPCAVFPAAHPAVGDLEICDDGDELIVVAGNFTHGHFSDFDQTLTADEKQRRIVDAVLRFLDDLFADRVVLWGSHEAGGGWYYPEYCEAPEARPPEYVWSGPRPA